MSRTLVAVAPERTRARAGDAIPESPRTHLPRTDRTSSGDEIFIACVGRARMNVNEPNMIKTNGASVSANEETKRGWRRAVGGQLPSADRRARGGL